jgi:hypothetical protein
MGLKLQRLRHNFLFFFFFFFSDDTLLFSRANIHKGGEFLNILANYQQASGQVVNLDKSEASKRVVFSFVMDRVWNKVKGWK